MAQDPLHPEAPSGTISGNANTLYSLQERLQTQLDPDCVGVAQSVTITADLSNTAAVNLGKASPVAGNVSSTNYGYPLNPGSSQSYRSSYPGSESPVSVLQIFSTQNWILHVDVVI
jgi:hypothetical protein